MVEATFHFPREFLWGCATAAHQVEGNNKANDWWAWEQESGRIAQGHVSGKACDWWGGRWAEDFDRAADNGQNAHRLSLEWSRIAPEPDGWNQDALAYYREILQGARDRGLRPMVTLHHFTNPQWFVEMGGWSNPGLVPHFERYVRKAVTALKDLNTEWVTINEPNVYFFMAYMEGVFPPGEKDLGKALQVAVNLLRGHAAAYHAIHEIQPEAQVGFAHHYRGMDPARPKHGLDRLLVRLRDQAFNHLVPSAATDGIMRLPWRKIHIPEAAHTQDFFGLNYYTVETVRFSIQNAASLFADAGYREDDELSATGFIANRPDGFWRAMQWANSFGLPMYITEHGIEDPADGLRRRNLALHLREAWRAVNYTWPLRGYFHWSLVDNFEWERGWTQRFGLWELDVETQERRKRPSVDFYRAICEANGLSSEHVEKFAPEVHHQLFPADGPGELQTG